MEIVVTTFVVTYDLINQKSHQTLWDEFERLSAHRAFEFVWLLNLDNSAKEIYDHLKTFFDRGRPPVGKRTYLQAALFKC